MHALSTDTKTTDLLAVPFPLECLPFQDDPVNSYNVGLRAMDKSFDVQNYRKYMYLQEAHHFQVNLASLFSLEAPLRQTKSAN